MQAVQPAANLNRSYAKDENRYARCIAASKRIRWDIDKDVIRDRQFDFSKKFLPDGLSRVNELEFLSPADKRLMSQIQGRSYANIFGLVERFIAAKVMEVSRGHCLGDQAALEALVRFTEEELKHQADNKGRSHEKHDEHDKPVQRLTHRSSSLRFGV